MEVTDSNYGVVVDSFLEELKTCNFVAFDLELSGVSNEPRITLPVVLEPPQERYKKISADANSYGILQCGFALFFKKSDTEFECKPYNFWVRPRSLQSEGYDPEIKFRASGLDFHKREKTNLTKWVSESVTYVDGITEEKIFKKMRGRPIHLAVHPPSQRPSLSEDQEKIVRENVELILNWRGCQSSGLLELQGTHLRQTSEAISYELNAKTPDLFLEFKPSEKRWLSVLTVHQLTEKEKEEKCEAILNQSIGFRRIFKALKKEKKPIVGHGLIIDLLFLVKHMEGQIPQSCDEFLTYLSQNFPIIYDTKHIATYRDPFTTALTLGKYHDFVNEQFKNFTFSLPEKFERYKEPFLHEGAYDAYITGKLFAILQKEIETHNNQYMNKLFLYKSIYIIDTMNKLEEEQIYLTNIPSKADNKYFSQLLETLKWKRIVWIDDQSAFLVFSGGIEDSKNIKDKLVSEGMKILTLQSLGNVI